MSEYWFKPKTYGYGATPSHWKGWALTLVFPLVLLAPTWLLLVEPATHGQAPSPTQIAGWIGILAVATLAFILLAKSKTDAPWKWRWGEKE